MMSFTAVVCLAVAFAQVNSQFARPSIQSLLQGNRPQLGQLDFISQYRPAIQNLEGLNQFRLPIGNVPQQYQQYIPAVEGLVQQYKPAVESLAQQYRPAVEKYIEQQQQPGAPRYDWNQIIQSPQIQSLLSQHPGSKIEVDQARPIEVAQRRAI